MERNVHSAFETALRTRNAPGRAAGMAVSFRSFTVSHLKDRGESNSESQDKNSTFRISSCIARGTIPDKSPKANTEAVATRHPSTQNTAIPKRGPCIKNVCDSDLAASSSVARQKELRTRLLLVCPADAEANPVGGVGELQYL
jgi:hypothetical protein